MTRLRFTIRDLLWLTAVVALGAGWLTNLTILRHERQKLADTQAELDRWMKYMSEREKVLNDQAKAVVQNIQAYEELKEKLEKRLHELDKSASSPPAP